jgi:hypothetical protein
VHSLLIALATTPAPAPSPSLRPGVTADQVTPGLLGFLLTAFIVVLTALLIVDMVRRIRRVRYRAQVEEERAAAGEAAVDGETPVYREQVSPEAVSPDAGNRNAGNRNAGSRNADDGAGTRPDANGDAGPRPR